MSNEEYDVEINNLDDFKSVLLDMADDEGLSISSLDVALYLTMTYEGHDDKLYNIARQELNTWLIDNNFIMDVDQEVIGAYFITRNCPPIA